MRFHHVATNKRVGHVICHHQSSSPRGCPPICGMIVMVCHVTFPGAVVVKCSLALPELVEVEVTTHIVRPAVLSSLCVVRCCVLRIWCIPTVLYETSGSTEKYSKVPCILGMNVLYNYAAWCPSRKKDGRYLISLYGVSWRPM